MTIFEDRHDAGRRLAAALRYLSNDDVVVLGLPRGGVPVAYEVARALHAPLDVIVVRKLGLPFQPELAMGAIGEGGIRVLDPDVLAHTTPSDATLRAVEKRERGVLRTRVDLLRRGRPPVSLQGRIAVVVDDGIATGSSAHAACEVARELGAVRVVVATPVAPAGMTAEDLSADELVCCTIPSDFHAVGDYYRDFMPTTDREVATLLGATLTAPDDNRPSAVVPDVDTDDVHIVIHGGLSLPGSLHVPAGARGVVLFAHGSGSNRLYCRDRYVAAQLHTAGLATLLFDLLSPTEDDSRGQVFDIAFLGSRVVEVGRWLLTRPEVEGCRLGYFGTSSGAGAALWAAAEPGCLAQAVVSRGGPPDLAGERLSRVIAPTLFIVGGSDTSVLDLNRRELARMQCETRLVVVPGATHLFEEPGTLELVARLASVWFRAHLLDEDRDGARGHPA